MTEKIGFELNGSTRQVPIEKLVLKEKNCTQKGTTYHVMEMGALEVSPSNANYLKEISPNEFASFTKQYPNVAVIKVDTD